VPEQPTSRSVVDLAPGEGTSSHWLGTDLHTFKAVTQTTGGAYTLTELTARPEFVPPPHIHHREDEAFYVLEGRFEFSYEGRTFTAGPGSFVYLAKGRVHQHGASGGPARALVVHTPSGLEHFIAEAGKPATDRSAVPAAPPLEELQQMVAIAQKYGIEVPPPPSSTA
jgi:quercetin dioxygenase-like cupin family protein